MIDYFISYTTADDKWAEWIAWTLEAHGHTTVLQKWDFVPGSNFVLEMHKAATSANRTIVVLSPDYPASRYGAAEWAAAFSNDPDSMRRALVPVRVRETPAEGLLKAVVYIDLVGLNEKAAEERLLNGLKGERNKPTERPPFPGATPSAPMFPGADRPIGEAAIRPGYMPRIRGAISDRDKRRFVKDVFATIQNKFNASLMELARRNQGVEFELTPVDATRFTAEVFVGGKSRAQCKIWMGGMFGGDQIAYSDGASSRHSDSMNEILTWSDSRDELALSAMMNMSGGNVANGLNLKHLQADDAAEYLWRRFSQSLER